MEVDVEVVEAERGVWVLRRDGEQTIASVDPAGSGGSVKMTVEIRRPGADPLVLAAEVTDARRAKIAVPARAGHDAAPVIVRSPIPGRVVKILVKADDAVKAGQTIVVLEAMKMENELRAPRAGRVTTVRCAEGTAVEAGQDLVTIV
ncbi:MAG TPA: acetyl-CoA carboxylase biotin carboxyl carrier protein subunit [Polyangia bacterium]|nr:acetyl-CoA carboxylase biotin carboxyl carrier protein subunit [Polyangia bacterium]